VHAAQINVDDSFRKHEMAARELANTNRLLGANCTHPVQVAVSITQSLSITVGGAEKKRTCGISGSATAGSQVFHKVVQQRENALEVR